MPLDPGSLVEASETDVPHDSDYLLPEERLQREETKARLRERVVYQQMARNIRARLQYLHYKVINNVTHMTFDELEARVNAQYNSRSVPQYTQEYPVTSLPANARESSDARESFYAHVTLSALVPSIPGSANLHVPLPLAPAVHPTRRRDVLRPATNVSLGKRKASDYPTLESKRLRTVHFLDDDDDTDVQAAAMLANLSRSSGLPPRKLPGPSRGATPSTERAAGLHLSIADEEAVKLLCHIGQKKFPSAADGAYELKE